MPGSPPDPAARLTATFARWLADPDSDVVHVEEVEGRWAVRMRQAVRDATTVWWELGERSLRFEAYVLPEPMTDPGEVYRQCLVRNATAWRAHFALDREGAVVLRGRLPVDRVEDGELDLVLGEIYELVEVAFRGLVRAGFGAPVRETSP